MIKPLVQKELHLIKKVDWNIVLVIQGLTYDTFVKDYRDYFDENICVPVNTNAVDSTDWLEYNFNDCRYTIPYICGVDIDTDIDLSYIFDGLYTPIEYSEPYDLHYEYLNTYDYSHRAIIHYPSDDLDKIYKAINKDLIDQVKSRKFVITGDSDIAPWYTTETETWYRLL